MVRIEGDDKQKEFTVRTPPLQVFRGIRFINTFPDRFTGHLRYLRDFYTGNSVADGDLLDKAILEALASYFNTAHVSCKTLLLFDQQLEDCLKQTNGGANKDIVFYFIPTGDPQTLLALHNNKELKAPGKLLNTTFWFEKGDPKISVVPDQIWVHVALSEINTHFSTIKKI